MGVSRVEREKVMIIGTRPMADLLMKRLRSHGIETLKHTVRDLDSEKDAKDRLHLRQQALSKSLRAAGINEVKTLIALNERDEINYRVCRQAAQVFGVENVIALVKDPGSNAKFRELGARVVNMAYSTALIIESMALSEDAFSIAADLDEFQEVREVKVLNPELNNRLIADLGLADSVHVLLLVRAGEAISPDDTTVLQINDIATLVGDGDQLTTAARLLSQAGQARRGER
jgi:Trk K+ transport system NAD-binding subunit